MSNKIRIATARDLLAKIDNKRSIFTKIDELESNVNKLQRSEIMAEDISDISSSLGTVVQGEQAYGEGSLEGNDYTGMIIRYPAITIDGVDYSFLGMNNGVLQVGLSYTDGKIYAGAGAVTLDENGVTATAGTIGGWTLGATDFTSDSGNVKISSLLPSIEMGASGFTTGEGIWFGKDGGTYKFRLGTEQSNVSPQYVTWDGSELKVMGNVSISAGATIGGWLVGANNLSADSGSVSLSSAVPSILFGATDYSTGTGIWMGKDSGVYKLRVGNPSGQYITWDGTTLTVVGAVSISAGATIAGWNITTDTIEKTGIILNSTDDAIYVGASSPQIVIDGASKSIYSDNYTGGASGFILNGVTGNVEVNNLIARGELRSSVFTKGEVSTTAGTQGVFKSAGKLKTDVTTVASPTTFNVDVDDPASGHAALFAVGDILRLKDGLADAWATVSSVSNQTTYYRYVCTLSYGTVGTFKAGMAVVDYGQSGDGYLILTADQTNAPYLSVQTHTGSPWSSTSEVGRFGKLDGIGTLSGYGWFVGDVATNYAYYNTTDGLMLKGKGVSLTKNNIPVGEVLEIDTGYSYVVGPDLVINGDVTVSGDLILVG